MEKRQEEKQEKKEDEVDELLRGLRICFIVAFIISSFFEVGLLIVAYVYADEVKCNLLWCSFIYKSEPENFEHIESYSNFTSTSTQSCFENGEKINCSEINNKIINALKNYG
jgi:hypothetical protein